MPKEINISDKGKPTEEIKTETLIVEQPSINPKKPDKEIIKNKPPKVTKPINKNFLIFGIVAFLVVSGIALFFYFGIYKVRPISPESVVPFSEDFVSSVKGSQKYSTILKVLDNPSEPRTEVSPLNGLLFTKKEMAEMLKRRPVAVMSSNHVDARPLSGLSSSDIVIEANVEGGITRHMAIYWSEAPERVGSVRSVRQYYLEWASEYSPLFIRVGCASSTDSRINACGNIRLYDNVKDIDIFWRWNDGRRYAPHNAYSSVTSAWEKAEKYNWDSFPDVKSWSFKRDADLDQRGENMVAQVTFHTALRNSGDYDVLWTYDKTTNTYFRKVGGQVDIDQETNKQLTAKNIVIQNVKMVYSGDSKGHMIITTIGQGDAKFLFDGKITEGTWKKDSRNSRTMYYDSSGKEIQFNRGRIWIEMVSLSYGKFAIIE
ncbi:MAG: DUF3048 domain-containing protein [Candidatus Dojkabacteria bacterium]|nr:DUF3048 domain-containing protein [Candidatus Dojkabacteria bacterium]